MSDPAGPDPVSFCLGGNSVANGWTMAAWPGALHLCDAQHHTEDNIMRCHYEERFGRKGHAFASSDEGSAVRQQTRVSASYPPPDLPF